MHDRQARTSSMASSLRSRAWRSARVGAGTWQAAHTGLLSAVGVYHVGYDEGVGRQGAEVGLQRRVHDRDGDVAGGRIAPLLTAQPGYAQVAEGKWRSGRPTGPGGPLTARGRWLSPLPRGIGHRLKAEMRLAGAGDGLDDAVATV